MKVLSACVLCKGKSLMYYGKARDYLVSNQEFTIMQCKECGFVFTNPQPDETELGKYYLSEDYISHHDSGNSVFQQLYKAIRSYMLTRKIKMISKHLTNNTKPVLLDYGCATGEFLKRAGDKGWITIGFEPSDEARNVAIAKGINVCKNLVELENHIKPGSLDVITMWHVLEHIGDPVEKSLFFSRLLKDDGLIVVAVPEYKSYDGQYYKENWAAWDLPRHLNHFDSISMKSLFSKAGFIHEATYPLVFDAFYIALLSEKQRNNHFTRLPRAVWVGLLSNFLAYRRKYPYSSMIYVFRKTLI